MYMGGSNMGIINSNLTKLGSFLGNEKLYIPEYQRGYSWEETQLDDFWLDLEQIYEENTHDEHFLGQVVIHKIRKMVNAILLMASNVSQPQLSS